jgi:hypothetical protein
MEGGLINGEKDKYIKEFEMKVSYRMEKREIKW